MISISRFYFLLLMIMASIFAVAQESIKYEKEIPIDSNVVPQNARLFIGGLKLDNIKWVKEFSYDGTSFEVKAMWNKLPVSIEFDTIGLFEDIEITIKAAAVSAEARKTIKAYLKQYFKKYKIEKIQLQFSGSLPELTKRMNNNDVNANYITRYEIELGGSIKTGWRHYEFLFDEQGKFLSKREIGSFNIDHVVF